MLGLRYSHYNTKDVIRTCKEWGSHGLEFESLTPNPMCMSRHLLINLCVAFLKMLLHALIYSVHQQLYAGMNNGIEICSAANLCQNLQYVTYAAWYL